MNDLNDDPRITAYVFDELPPAERNQFERELAESEELRSIVEETRQTIAWTETQFRASTEPLLSADQSLRVQRAAQRAESSGMPLAAVSGRGSIGPKLALAACLIVAATVTVFAISQYQARVATKQSFLANALNTGDSGLTAQQRLRDRFDQEAEMTANQDFRSPTPTYATPSGDKFAPENAAVVSGGLQPPDRDAVTDLASNVQVVSGQGQPLPLASASAPAPGESSTHVLNIELARLSDHEAKFYERRNVEVLRVDGREFASKPEGIQPGRFEGDPDEGRGPGVAGDQFEQITENDFVRVDGQPLSTFSIDVDTASYAKVRNYLQQLGRLPRADAVRLEELINYFTYDYAPPTDEHPFAAHLAVATCPWDARHRLVRIALKGQEIQFDQRPPSNLVFLLDVSGSMDDPNKLPLVKKGMRMLVDQLGENDRLAIVVYAGAAGLVMESTPCDRKEEILQALEQLSAGDSTNGGEGIRLAYQQAMDHFVPGGVNRVILCSDGDFNVGTTSNDELIRLVETNAKAKVDLTVLGFGMGNHNDSMLEQITNKGNGNYAFIDTEQEAKKVLVEQINGTLVTIAKDVKIQVEFNPQQVFAYRLLGYENRLLAAQDFNDDTKDAGEIGAGHTVTALYEVVPVGAANSVEIPQVDRLKYQGADEALSSSELLTLKLRYKQPAEDTSTKLEFPLDNSDASFGEMDRDFRFAAAVAGWGMLLRDSKYKGDLTYGAVLEIATEAAQDDRSGYRGEFLELVQQSRRLAE